MIELQNINGEIDTLTAKRVNLPQDIQRLGEELEDIEKELNEDEQKVEALKADHKAQETALKNSVEQVKKSKGRLFDVKSNKEYEALLKEIESIQAKNSSTEDEILRMLEAIDSAGEILKRRAAETAERRSMCEEEIRQMENDLNSIDSELEKAHHRRDDVRSKTDKRILKKFDMIRSRKGGIVIVPVWKAVCHGCHMNIPPQMYNELQRNDRLVMCPHCDRIIYWEDRNGGENA